MADSYSVLYGKYQRALISIKKLEQQVEYYQQKTEETERASKQIEKNTRYLCETILKKDKSLGSDGKEENAWFRQPLKEMVLMAQESLERYFPSMQNLMEKLIATTESRTTLILDLRADNDKMKKDHAAEIEKKDAAIVELTKIAEKGGADKKTVNKAAEKGIKDIPSNLGDYGAVDFEEEDNDSEENKTMYKESAKTVTEQEVKTYETPEPKAKVDANKKSKDAMKKAVSEKSSKNKEVVQNIAKNLKPVEIAILEQMGGYGKTRAPKITATLEEEGMKSTTISNALSKMAGNENNQETEKKRLLSRDILICQRRYIIYSLTGLGKDVYRELFKKEPVRSEKEKILAAHGTIEHGYGICFTADLFSKKDFVTKNNADVIWLTRNKEYTVKVGENSSYIPDIIIDKKNGEKFYIEYETTSCTESDLFAKCYKIASFSNELNFVVPSSEAKEKILRELHRWKEEYIKSFAKRVYIRVATYKEIESMTFSKKSDWKPIIDVDTR